MSRQRVVGAISFPAFLLAWTTGAVVAVGQLPNLERPRPEAGAAVLAPMAWQAPLPDLAQAEHESWRHTLASFARHSEVMNGTWQPLKDEVPAPAVRTAGPHNVPAATPARAMRVAAAEPPARARVIALAPGPKPEWDAEPQPIARLAPAAGSRPADAHPAEVAALQTAAAPRALEREARPAAVVRKAPSRPMPRLAGLKARAREDLEGGRYSDAYHRLRPNVGEARSDEEYLALLALAAMRMESFGEAMVIYERLTRVQPDRPRWHAGLALAREHLGLDATSRYREALALSDGSDDLRVLLEAKLAGDESFG